MSDPSPSLWVVTYHYVRDLPRTAFPRIRGRLVSELEQQVLWLGERCEMATLRSALEFLAGRYQPTRDLCLLTFDDGLKDHYQHVLPILAARSIQGIFFLSTACIEHHRVLPVHKNHFLLAKLDFDEYRSAFLDHLAVFSTQTPDSADAARAQQAYPWDSPDVAAFKFFLNYRLSEELRVRVLDELFVYFLGDESAFSQELYLSWNEARTMQEQGMIIGGHSNNHTVLSNLTPTGLKADLATCASVLRRRLRRQDLWPFCYPYGHSYSFDAATIRRLRSLDFVCAFTTVPRPIQPGDDLFTLPRIDTNDVLTRVPPAVQPKQRICAAS
jgi:peptidoglycan/xylan/chitin deacetylase (PgdA/CDA1 family)